MKEIILKPKKTARMIIFDLKSIDLTYLKMRCQRERIQKWYLSLRIGTLIL
jgi:hypothetical protein